MANNRSNFLSSSFRLVVVIAFSVLLFFPFALSAQTGTNPGSVTQSKSYELLAPIPEFCTELPCKYKYDEAGSFTKYVQSFMYLSIIVAAILAVIMIVRGGFKYMTSETLHVKAEGRQNMIDAVYGIIVLCVSFLILNTINPEILNFKLNIADVSAKKQPTQTTAQTDTYAQSDLTATSEKYSEARAQLNAKISNLRAECEGSDGKKGLLYVEDKTPTVNGKSTTLNVMTRCFPNATKSSSGGNNTDSQPPSMSGLMVP